MVAGCRRCWTQELVWCCSRQDVGWAARVLTRGVGGCTVEVPHTDSLFSGGGLLSFLLRPIGANLFPVLADGVSAWTHKCWDFELWDADRNLYFFKCSFFYIDVNVNLFCKDAPWRCVTQMAEPISFILFVISTELKLKHISAIEGTPGLDVTRCVCWCCCFGPPRTLLWYKRSHCLFQSTVYKNISILKVK